MSGRKRDTEMGFLGHLEILRRHVIAAFVVFLLAALAAFALMDRIMPLLTRPATSRSLALYALTPYEKLISYLKASALVGAVVALPVAAGLGASFVAPALDPRPRRLLLPLLAVVLLFVAAGVALCWLVVAPFAVGLLARFSSGDGIEPLWGLGSYISLVSGLIAATAIICLLPPVLLVLIRLGILEVATLAKSRRFVIAGIALIAGVVTPTVDVVSQCMVAAAMWGLFEITLLLGRVLERREGRKRAGATEALDGQT